MHHQNEKCGKMSNVTQKLCFFWNSFLLKRWILKRSLTCVNKDFTKKIVKREKLLKHENGKTTLG